MIGYFGQVYFGEYGWGGVGEELDLQPPYTVAWVEPDRSAEWA